MGRYGNQIGYHDVEGTTAFYELLESEGFVVDDTSWHNDTVDSLLVNGLLIFMANSDEMNPNEEKWNVFTIMKDEDYGCGDPLKVVDTVEEVITYLKCYPKKGLVLRKEKRIEI